MRDYSVVLLLVGVTIGQAAGQRPASSSELEAIATRGRMLAAYDAAAWTATDAVTALKPPPGTITHYIAVHAHRGWQVHFGHFNAGRDSFLVAYVAAQDGDNTSFGVSAHDPPLSDTDYIFRAARAADLARSAFRGEERPYNVAVLPAERGAWWVYVYPAQTDSRVWPLGADVRYRISADGSRVHEERRLHKTIIEYRVPTGRTPVAMTHRAVQDEVPEDTDVMMVLRRIPSVPEIVVTPSFAYHIETDGSVRYLGRNKELRVPTRP